MYNNTNKELMDMCLGIREDLRTLYAADYSDDERNEMEDNGEAVDLYSYFDDALDYEYSIGSRHDFRGVKVWLTLGGPNIWLNTQTGYIEGRWGTDSVSVPVDDKIIAEINGIFEDIYSVV